METSIGCRFHGEKGESSIKNVSIKDIKINGQDVTALSQLRATTNDYVSNLTYNKVNKVTGAHISLPYKGEVDANVNKTHKTGINQEGMLVPEFAYQQGGLPYIGVKASISSTNTVTHGAGTKTTTPVDDGSGDFTAEGKSPTAINDGNDASVFESKEYKNEEDEFVGITMEFSAESTIGKVRIKGPNTNKYFYTYTIEIWCKKYKSGTTTMNDKYTRLISAKDYEMTPASGNAIDINITTQVYGGLQLRFFRNNLASKSNKVIISEVEFYPPSLTYGKAAVVSTPHNDVYNIEKALDGDPTGTSYYESASLPATIIIDLGDVYTITTIVLCLPPSLNWPPRTQNIEFFVSNSNVAYTASTEFTQLKAADDYLFDPATGNRVTIEVTPTQCRFFKMVINSNDIAGGYAAQLSEISVYGV